MRTFVAVVEAGSFTAAADRLGMSKKLASKYVAEVENRLGVQLLQRTTRALSLTGAGQKYYPRCVALLEEFDAMSAEVREVETGLAGELRISAPVSFGEMFVQDALADFRAQHPALSIDLRLNDRFIDLTAEGFDLAIRIGDLDESSLIARKLAETSLVATASPEYLERSGRPAAPADLSDHCCIRDSNFRSGQSWPFEINGIVQRVPVAGGFMVNSAAAVRKLALRGEGIGLSPDFAVSADLRSGALTQVLEDYPSLQYGIYAVFSEHRRMPARTRATIEFLVQRFKQPPWTKDYT